MSTIELCDVAIGDSIFINHRWRTVTGIIDNSGTGRIRVVFAEDVTLNAERTKPVSVVRRHEAAA